MQNILLSAFSIPVLKAVVVTWTWTLSFTMGVTIYYYLNALFKTETWNGSFFCLFVFFFLIFCYYCFLLKMTKGHLQLLLFCCICFWSMLSFIGETTVYVFWQLSALSCSHTHFVPLLKPINKKNQSIALWYNFCRS